MPDAEKIDVTACNYVPKHEILPKGEEEKLLASLAVVKENLPRIKVTDPQCKALGAKVDDIIRIKRTDMGPNTYYRRVVK